MGLDIPTPKVPGTEVRRTPARPTAVAGGLIFALLILELVFMGLVFSAVYDLDGFTPKLAHLSAAGHDPAIPKFGFSIFGFKDVEFFTSEQTLLSFWLACTFFCLFTIIMLYQRCFLDHVTVAKRRFRKWEDEGVQLHG
jgi:hypothetical protein